MQPAPRGMTMVDVLVGSFLMLVIFLALMGLLRASLLVASTAKARAGAVAVGNTQMEYIRSFQYDSVGTVGGIPNGLIPQYATTTMNNIPYATHTFIEYVDDSADGSGLADANGITTDYKRIKVAVTYSVRGKGYELDFVSNYAPDSIETTTGGGTLKVQVVNASGAGVAGATVRVVNTALSVDLTTFSDTSGVVLLGGAMPSTEYQIYVSKSGYSSAQTYERDATNQNPTPGYLTVVANTTTTGTFAIDTLATLTLATFYPIAATSTSDSFADASRLAFQSNTEVSGGSLHIFNGATGYSGSGSARSVVIAPTNLVQWTGASTTMSVPAGTDLKVHVVDSTGTLLPDAVVPGNSGGFTSSFSLTGVSTTTYPSLALSADFSTTDASSTPALTNWTLHSLAGPLPVGNVAFTLSGAKTIGSTGAGAPIYKTTVNASTNSTGISDQSLEWDSYGLALAAYDVVDACAAPPYALSPGSSALSRIFVGPASTNAALVTVRDNTGAAVAGATVTLAKTGYTKDVLTSSCGTAYFGALTNGTYSVTITKTGYTTTTYTNVDIAGRIFYAASFP